MFCNFQEEDLFQSQEESDRQKKNAWLMTLNDLLSLLLTFFIMIYSLSEYSASLKDSGNEEKSIHHNLDKDYISKTVSLNVNYFYKVLVDKVKGHSNLKDLIVSNHGKKIVISIPFSSVFDDNKTEISTRANPIMDFLETELFDIKNPIDIYAVTNYSKVFLYNGDEKLLLNFKRVSVLADELTKNIFASNIKIFILNNEYYRISTEKSLTTDSQYSERIDIVINYEEAEKNFQNK